MNCHDARQGFFTLFRGGMSLTELALVEAHARQCVECRKERAYLQQVVSSRQRVAPSRAVLHCRRMVINATHFGTTRVVAWLARLHVVLVICFTVSVQAAGRVIAASRVGSKRGVGPLIRVRCLLPKLFKLSERAAANVIEATGFVITCFADLLARLRLSLTIAFQGAARVGIEAARAGVTLVLDLLTRVRCLLPALLRVPERAAVKTIGVTRVVGRIAVTTSGRALSLGLSAWTNTRRSDGNSTTNEKTEWARSQDVRPPVDREPAELAAGAQLAETSTPKPASAPQPAPEMVSHPETRDVAMRPQPPETQGEIPAPLRIPGPARVRSRAIGPAAMPSRGPARRQEVVHSQDGAGSQNAEASDPSAARDPLPK